MDNRKIKSIKMKSDDINQLFEIINKYKTIINCKKTDSVSNLKKNETWREITIEFNSTRIIKKTETQLRNAYKNKLGELRKTIAQERAERFSTGGGPFKSRITETNPLYSYIETSISPLANIDSSDVLYENIEICTELSEPSITHNITDPQTNSTNNDINNIIIINNEQIDQDMIECDNIEEITESNLQTPQPGDRVYRSRCTRINKSEELKNKMFEEIIKTEQLKQQLLQEKVQYYKNLNKNNES